MAWQIVWSESEFELTLKMDKLIPSNNIISINMWIFCSWRFDQESFGWVI